MRPRWLLLLAPWIAVLGGCAGSRPAPAPIVPPGSEGITREYVSALDRRAASIESMRAGLEMTWEDPRFEEAERCRGSLSFEQPGRARLRGISAAFFTVFDLVADERDVWLDVPREEFTVFGKRSDPAWQSLPLSPRWLLVAFLAHPCPQGDCLQRATIADSDTLTTLLVGEFGSLELDAQSGLPRRLISPEGVSVEWTEWSERAGVAWPDRIVLARGEGRRWTVGFGRVTLNGPIPPSRFVWSEEESREILTPADAVRRWEQ